MNRPALSERALVTLLGATTALGPVAVNIYLPVLPQVREAFHVSVPAASVTVSAALIAFACGLFAWGPLSDRHGRRPVVLAGLLINLAGALLALIAPTLTWLMVARVIQALGASAGVTVARAMIGDLFARERMARIIAYLTMAMLLANSLAPAAGGAIAELAGWRAVFVVLVALALAVSFAVYRYLPETRGPEHRHDNRQILATTRRLCALPAFVGLALISGAIYAEFFVFVSLMPYVFAQALGHSGAEYGLWYLWIAGGYFAGNWFVSHYAARLGLHRLLALGLAVTALAAIGDWALVAAGFWHPLAVFAPWFVITFGQGLTLPTLTATAVALAPRSAGIASGLLGFSQQIIGALAVQAMSLSSVLSPAPVAAFAALTALAAWLAFAAFGRSFLATASPGPR